MKTRILTFTLSIFLCVAARAELKWEQSTIDLHPSVSDKTAVAHFKYQNTGTTPVHFKSEKASCGCTTTQTQKEMVNPGEKGEIVATFTIGDRTGQQIKTVTAQSEEPNPAQATSILTLKATIQKSFYVNLQLTNPPGAPSALKPNAPNAPAVKAATPPAIPKASPSAGVER